MLRTEFREPIRAYQHLVRLAAFVADKKFGRELAAPFTLDHVALTTKLYGGRKR